MKVPAASAGPAAACARPSLFKGCLAVSLAAHALIWLGLVRQPRFSPSSGPEIEIDLTKPLGTGPAKLAAPKRLVTTSGPVGPAHLSSPVSVAPKNTESVQAPTPAQAVAGKHAQSAVPQQGTSDGTQAAPAPGGNPRGIAAPPSAGGTADGSGIAPRPGGSGEGAADGVPGGRGDGGADLLSLPRLLNRDEVLASLRRFYPEKERRAGHEGQVVVALHIGADGIVGKADIVRSAGGSFDQAAQAVARLMRFSPALSRSGPVAVKLKQTIYFQLKDE